MTNQISIYHDALLQRGGAEQVATQWALALDKGLTVIGRSTERSMDGKIKVKVLLPWLKTQRVLELLYPFLPFLYLFINPSKDKLRLVSTTGIAHHFPGKWEKRVLYIHSPARWIWDKESFDINRKKIEIIIANILRPIYKFYDRKSIRKNDVILVNSNATKSKVSNAYSRDSLVVFPPICAKHPVSKKIQLPNDFSKFFLHVGRVRGYKGLDFILETFDSIESKIVLVGESTAQYRTKSVLGLGFVEPSELRWLYENAEALVAVSREDFGLTPVEASNHGCPTLAFGHLGYLDSVKNGKTGKYVTPNDIAEMRLAILNHQKSDYSEVDMREFAEQFSIETHMNILRNYL